MPTFYRLVKNRPRGKHVKVQREFSELEKRIVRIAIEHIGHMAITQKIQTKQNVVVRIEGDQMTTDFDQLIEAADWLSSWGIFIENSNGFLMMSPFPSIFYKKSDYLEITVLDRMVPYFEELFNNQQIHLLDS